MLSADVDETFVTNFPTACAKISCSPRDLLGVMFSESGCKPAAHNNGPPGEADPTKRYNAVGLIQFMPATLKALGFRGTYEDFKRLTASEQLRWVIMYYAPWAKDAGAWDSAGRLYQATFLPGTLKTLRDPDSVLAAKKGRLGWAYEANTVFDANGDGQITISELTDAVHRNCKGDRWRELCARLGLDDGDTTSETIDEAIERGDLDDFLSTVRGTQEALAHLGYDIGASGADGFWGARSKAAAMAFQLASDLHADGIVGPKTRNALTLALA